MSYVGVD